MSTKKLLCVMFALILSIGIFAFPQSAASDVSASSTPQVTSMQGPPDPPTTRLIREYQLPAIPFATVAYLGPARTPFDVAYDSNGYAWITDIARDTIYQLTPATLVNQSSTTAKEWVLPNTAGKRSPLYIVSDDAPKVVWFTNPTSHQISRLASNGTLTDWDLSNLNIMPLDLVLQTSNSIWFTAFNNSHFYRLQVPNTLFTYTMNLPTGGPAPVKPTRLAFNGTFLFLTDAIYDKLYEVPLPPAVARVYNLPGGGFAWDVDVDTGNNAWVTQPQSSLIDEQLVNSTAKSSYNIVQDQISVSSASRVLKPNVLDVKIQITAETPNAYPGPLNVTADPLVVWYIPTGVTALTYVPPPAKPWDVATSADGYAWFTEPLYNHVGVIQPTTGTILLYPVPTAQSLPLSMDIQPGNPLNDYHVWFTEYRVGQIGELFNSTIAFDVTVAPSLPAQYPPPPPGSIRWTTSEIWFDSHSAPLTGGVSNTLYARIENLGPVTATSIVVRFYYYANTSYNIGYNYIPLPPSAPSSGDWTLIGTTTIGSIAPGGTVDASVTWVIPATVSANFTIGVQVSVSGDTNVYNNVAYANFSSLTPAGVPAFTLPGLAGGFIAGAIVGGLIIGVLRRPQGMTRKAKKL